MGRDNEQSGRRGYRGQGRGQGRFTSRGRRKAGFKPHDRDLKFYPQGAANDAKGGATFDTIKQHIVQQVQRTYKNGIDIAQTLKTEVMVDLDVIEPVRKISTKNDAVQRHAEQEGFDIKYKMSIGEHLKRVNQLEENLTKAYALIFSSYCSRTMQIRVEEHPDFSSVIENNPIE